MRRPPPRISEVLPAFEVLICRVWARPVGPRAQVRVTPEFENLTLERKAAVIDLAIETLRAAVALEAPADPRD